MSEEDFRKEVERFFNAKLNEWKLDSFLEVGKTKILTDFTIAPDESGKFLLYAGFLEQDVVIYLKGKHVNLSGDIELFRTDEVKIPFLIAEVKLARNFNIHQLITYSAIASKIRTVFPHCLYFMIIQGKRRFKDISLMRHAKSLEVFDDWDSHKTEISERIRIHLQNLARNSI